MKKFINRWNVYTVYAFIFNNNTDLCNYVRKAKINTRIFPLEIVKEAGSEGSDRTYNGGGWFQTKDLNQAIEFCLNGWYAGFDSFARLKNTLDYGGDKIPFLPKDKSKPINILVNLSYNWETTRKAIVNRGVIIQNLIKELERNGYKVNLKTFSLIEEQSELSCIVVKLKGVNERLDPRKAYFAFCNPSFLRRLVFRVMESSDFKYTGWNEGYGYPCDSHLIKAAFSTKKLDIVIPQPWEIGINGEDIFEDWKQFLNFEGLQDYFN